MALIVMLKIPEQKNAFHFLKRKAFLQRLAI